MTILGVPLLLLAAVRYVPIFSLSRRIDREAEVPTAMVRRQLVEAMVDRVATDLRIYCLRQGRAPQPAEILRKPPPPFISEVKLETVSFRAANDCSSRLKFLIGDRRFEVDVPAPQSQRWAFPEN